MAGERVHLLGLREGGVHAQVPAAAARQDAGQPDGAVRRRRPRRRQPGLLVPRRRRRARLPGVPLLQRQLPEAASRASACSPSRRGSKGKVQAAVAALSLESRARYRRLLRECGLILGIAPATGQNDLGTLSDMRAGGLNQLLWLFLRLLTSREVISSNLSQVDRASLEAEVDRVRERLARAEKDSALARSLQATLDIQIKRLENLTKAISSLEVIDAELERIEQQVRLIREEIGGLRRPGVPLGPPRRRHLDARRDLAVDGPERGVPRHPGRHRRPRGGRAAAPPAGPDHGAAPASPTPRPPEGVTCEPPPQVAVILRGAATRRA